MRGRDDAAPRRRRRPPAANAARSAIGQVCIVAGPGFGALLLLIGPPSLAFALNGATFALSALAVASLPAGAHLRARGEPDDAPNVLRELGEGARALLAQPVARRLVGADVMSSAVYGAETVLLLMLSRELGLGDHGYGYLLASFGLGGVLGAGIAGRAAAGAGVRTVLVVALAALAACTALLADPFGLAGALALGVVGGASSIVVEVMADTGLQRVLPPDVFARAYGFAYPAALAGIVAGSLVAAPLVALFGLRGAFLALGALVAPLRAHPAAPSAARRRRLPRRRPPPRSRPASPRGSPRSPPRGGRGAGPARPPRRGRGRRAWPGSARCGR